jgi:CHAT domain-containing protein
VERLIVVPDGPLRRLPFAVLRLHDDRWLVEDVALAVAPSATVLSELRSRPSTPAARQVIAFAASAVNPTAERLSPAFRARGRSLEHAEQEVQDAMRLLGGSGPAQRTETAVRAIGDAHVRVVHFAAHAVADEAAPRRSGILLEPDDREDGWLQVHEIPHVSMPADLVVLATCRSHAGRFVRGEGLLGLSRAFMRAGARAVVATLWEVEDAETRRFVRAFYRELASGDRPDTALREAQLQMIRAGGRSADPRAWASFVLTGDASHVLFEAPVRSSRWIVAASLLSAAVALGLVWVVRRRRAGVLSNVEAP